MIATYLDLSFAHLEEDTVELLQELDGVDRAGNGWPAMTVANYPGGMFVTVPPLDLEGVLAQAWRLPDDLYAALLHAFNAGAYVVRFDVDGDTVDSLKTYDW